MDQINVLNFSIRNSFKEWARSYDASIPGQKMAGITSLSRGCNIEDPSHVCAIMLAKPGVIEAFIKDNVELIKSSGHILETTKISVYEQE